MFIGLAVEVEQCDDTIIDLTESFNSSCCIPKIISAPNLTKKRSALQL